MGATIRHTKMCQLVISFQIIILLLLYSNPKKKKLKKKKKISKSIKTFRVGLTDRVGRVTGNEQLFFLGLCIWTECSQHRTSYSLKYNTLQQALPSHSVKCVLPNIIKVGDCGKV